MALNVRRVIVENDAHGRSVVAGDAALPPVAEGAAAGISNAELWSTGAMPVDNGGAAGAEQRSGELRKGAAGLFVGNGQGTTFRITEFAPGHQKVSHRTETLDYDVVLAGEVDLEVDGGETLHLKAGDVAVVRGATHAWINRTQGTALVAFVLTDAKPAVADGRELRTEVPGA